MVAGARRWLWQQQQQQPHTQRGGPRSLSQAAVREPPTVDKDDGRSSSSNGAGTAAPLSSTNSSSSNGQGSGNGLVEQQQQQRGNGEVRYATTPLIISRGTAERMVAGEGRIAKTADSTQLVVTVNEPIPERSTLSATLDNVVSIESSQEEDESLVGHLHMAASLIKRKIKKSALKINLGGSWSKVKKYSAWQRTVEIWSFAVKFACRYVLLDQKWTYGEGGMTPEAVSSRRSELAAWLREGLTKLGPTFIKIGQQFSTRVDVLSVEFVKELEKLQDNVPPFDSEEAVRIIEDGLGSSVDSIFEEFDRQPVAAASLGQVHIATLNGEKVVVKVQRPGLRELFDIDTKNIRALAVWLQSVDPKSDGAARDWVAIYDECSRILYEEIDYMMEADSAERFGNNFKDVSWIKVPKVYRQYTTPQVLVLEYCPGTKINDGKTLDRYGLDRRRLARLMVESYLQQILRHGFFHADPHPGNVAVDAEGGGRLIYYDFGMMGYIPNDIRGGLLDLFYGVYNKDADRCLDAMVAMGVLVPGPDLTAVRRTAKYLLDSFQERLDEQKKEREEKGEQYYTDWSTERNKAEFQVRKKKALANIGEDLLLAAADQPFRFPATFTFVVRAFSVLDGIGKSLDPRFDMTEIAAPYARDLLLEGRPQYAKAAEELKRGIANQNRAFANLFKNPNRIDDISNVITRLERGDLKLRVRALETERALSQIQLWQRVVTAALCASTFINVGTVLSVNAFGLGATVSFVGAAICGFVVLSNYLKILNLQNKERLITGQA